MKKIMCRGFLVAGLAGVAVAAQAQLYKCQQGDGSFAFQDAPCATGSKSEVLNVHSASGDTMGVAGSASRGAMTFLKAAVKLRQSQLKASDAAVACVRNLSDGSLTSTFSSLLNSQLSADERHEADVFYSSTAGQKLMNAGARGLASALGNQAGDAPPSFIDAELRQIENFKHTSAGRKMMSINLWTGPDAQRMLTPKMRELFGGCGVHI
ncbi:MAG: DUF4124 domain-containing protein [Burkholderiales bacterium]|nr:DUF4124 domain-containing protein [Burkholderiales bacterium]